MADSFIVTVNYKGEEHDFEATLVRTGYVYKFQVIVDDVILFYEKDEEENYRAVIPYEADQTLIYKIDVELLKLIAEKITLEFS
jgi:hypothetical protein